MSANEYIKNSLSLQLPACCVGNLGGIYQNCQIFRVMQTRNRNCREHPPPTRVGKAELFPNTSTASMRLIVDFNLHEDMNKLYWKISGGKYEKYNMAAIFSCIAALKVELLQFCTFDTMAQDELCDSMLLHSICDIAFPKLRTLTLEVELLYNIEPLSRISAPNLWQMSLIGSPHMRQEQTESKVRSLQPFKKTRFPTLSYVFCIQNRFIWGK